MARCSARSTSDDMERGGVPGLDLRSLGRVVLLPIRSGVRGRRQGRQRDRRRAVRTDPGGRRDRRRPNGSRRGRRFTMKRSFILLIAIAVTGMIVGAGSAEATPRSGALHVTKECSRYDGTAGSFCTITSSNIPQIMVGSRVV